MLFREDAVPERLESIKAQIFEMEFFAQLLKKIFRFNLAAFKGVPKGV